jgi:hypothetical protein
MKSPVLVKCRKKSAVFRVTSLSFRMAHRANDAYTSFHGKADSDFRQISVIESVIETVIFQIVIETSDLNSNHLMNSNLFDPLLFQLPSDFSTAAETTAHNGRLMQEPEASSCQSATPATTFWKTLSVHCL